MYILDRWWLGRPGAWNTLETGLKQAWNILYARKTFLCRPGPAYSNFNTRIQERLCSFSLNRWAQFLQAMTANSRGKLGVVGLYDAAGLYLFMKYGIVCERHHAQQSVDSSRIAIWHNTIASRDLDTSARKRRQIYWYINQYKDVPDIYSYKKRCMYISFSL